MHVKVGARETDVYVLHNSRVDEPLQNLRDVRELPMRALAYPRFFSGHVKCQRHRTREPECCRHNHNISAAFARGEKKPCNPQIDILSGDILPLVGLCKKILGDQRGEHWRLFRYVAGKPSMWPGVRYRGALSKETLEKDREMQHAATTPCSGQITR